MELGNSESLFVLLFFFKHLRLHISYSVCVVLDSEALVLCASILHVLLWLALLANQVFGYPLIKPVKM